MKYEDMSGNKYNRLTAIRLNGNDKSGGKKWICKCECGNEVTVPALSLKNGHTKSCGCYKKDVNGRRFAKHWKSNTKLYKRWHSMKSRCMNPKHSSYKGYGGRGITICDEWLNFENFEKWSLANGFKENLTIERIDVNKGYNPNNCKYATRTEQNRNTTRNIRQFIDGEWLTISEIARKINVSRWSVLRWYHDEGLRGVELFERKEKMPECYK